MACSLEKNALNINKLHRSFLSFSPYICVPLKRGENPMERQSFKITFYLRRNRVTKAGLAPILSRVTVNGIAAEIPVKCHIYPERWNQQKERATGKDKLSVEINAALDIFRARALEIRTQIQQEGREVSVQEIKRRLTQATATRMFLQEFGNYCDVRQKEVGIQITRLTANKFKRVHRYLTEYTRTEYKKEDLPLPFIDHEYVYGFKIFIQTRYKCGNNGAVNLLKALRNFLLYCQRNEWLEKNPMRDLKLKVETNGIRAHLSKSELERMIAKEIPNDRLSRVRDVFVFCCLTGLAFSDADSLKTEHIGSDDAGNMWIHKPRQKTSVMSVIPLLPYARRILERYSVDSACMERGKLLPVCSNQRMNSYLKELAAICHIDKLLTTHCARHTYATEIALSHGVPMETVSRMLGHSRVGTTQIYAQVTDDKIDTDTQALDEKISQYFTIAI